MRDLLDPTYAGPMLNLYRQGKSIEMLLHQFEALETVRPSQQLRPAELWRIREARERLLADLANPPELEALARSVGLSAKRLTAGFKSVYGMTVFDYLLEARMTAAREMLEDGAELPLKQLAWRLGYAHPSNFVIAFRRRFGIAPGAYRRSRN
jgi:AraC-like DNA-binding protein